MASFKHEALEMIEDSLLDLDTPQGRGIAIGLCGAFHLCNLISEQEWEWYMHRITKESNAIYPVEEYKTSTLH